jgi:hypothetical protein
MTPLSYQQSAVSSQEKIRVKCTIQHWLTDLFLLMADPQTPEGFMLNMVTCQQPLFLLTANG